MVLYRIMCKQGSCLPGTGRSTPIIFHQLLSVLFACDKKQIFIDTSSNDPLDLGSWRQILTMRLCVCREAASTWILCYSFVFICDGWRPSGCQMWERAPTYPLSASGKEEANFMTFIDFQKQSCWQTLFWAVCLAQMGLLLLLLLAAFIFLICPLFGNAKYLLTQISKGTPWKWFCMVGKSVMLTIFDNKKNLLKILPSINSKFFLSE